MYSKNGTIKNTLIANCESWPQTNDSALFLKILSQPCSNIKIEDLGGDGDIVFVIGQKELGLDDEDIKKYSIMKSNYFANFMGEFIVRKNVNKFIKLLLKMDSEEYSKTVCGFNHKNFGMFVCCKNKTFKFQFHISLLQDIFTEELNNIVTIKK